MSLYSMLQRMKKHDSADGALVLWPRTQLNVYRILPKENAAQFSAGEAIAVVSIFVPPGTHHCWVDRGSVDSNLA